MSIFKIKGQAQKVIAYDIVEIEISFVSRNKDSYTASMKVMEESERFLNEANTIGLSSEMFALSEDRTDEGFRDDGEFKATRAIQIRLPFDMERINQIRAILDEGRFSAEFNLDYEYSKMADLHRQLLSEALQDSKSSAEVLAKGMGMKVKGIESINVEEKEAVTMDWMEQECHKVFRRKTFPYVESNKLKPGETCEEASLDVKWIIE